MIWPETKIETRQGLVRAIAPEIISASRSTDIPAFYSEWFMTRLREGYVKWVNPFNLRLQYISFENTRVIVFWSKNPRPLVPFLPEIEARGLAYYFHFTLNDYEHERLEPGVPPLKERIETFVSLSTRIGKERVIWRFDPLILTPELGVEGLLEKIKRVGDKVGRHTTKLVFSFADIGRYRKVQANLKRAGINYLEFSEAAMTEAAKGIQRLCNQWGISASTCAEPIELSFYGIEHNKCIDDDLILRITNCHPGIRRLLGLNVAPQGDMFAPLKETRTIPKDPGQREACGCVLSKDIGQYNTCSHLCTYCYANSSEKAVRRNSARASRNSESIITFKKQPATNDASGRDLRARFVNDLLYNLPKDRQRGSKPRCHWITEGRPEEVASRLTRLIAPWGEVTANDRWMPQGFEQTDEAELHKATSLLSPKHCQEIKNWWFKVFKGRQTGPSFDIASTCTVTVEGAGHPGLLLLEAKAHDRELQNEEGGKKLPEEPSSNQSTNDERIRKVIADANTPFEIGTGMKWALSCDSRYQMSNRFASVGKLAELGYWVILVYLGFLNTVEMRNEGNPIASAGDWEKLVVAHSKRLFPEIVWNQPLKVHGQWFIPLIRSTEIGYDRPPSSDLIVW